MMRQVFYRCAASILNLIFKILIFNFDLSVQMVATRLKPLTFGMMRRVFYHCATTAGHIKFDFFELSFLILTFSTSGSSRAKILDLRYDEANVLLLFYSC